MTTPIQTYAQNKKLSVSEENAIKLGFEALIGKSVTVQLMLGEDISGTVEEVGPSVVCVAQLSGKEFYSLW